MKVEELLELLKGEDLGAEVIASIGYERYGVYDVSRKDDVRRKDKVVCIILDHGFDEEDE